MTPRRAEHVETRGGGRSGSRRFSLSRLSIPRSFRHDTKLPAPAQWSANQRLWWPRRGGIWLFVCVEAFRLFIRVFHFLLPRRVASDSYVRRFSHKKIEFHGARRLPFSTPDSRPGLCFSPSFCSRKRGEALGIEEAEELFLLLRGIYVPSASMYKPPSVQLKLAETFPRRGPRTGASNEEKKTFANR